MGYTGNLGFSSFFSFSLSSFHPFSLPLSHVIFSRYLLFLFPLSLSRCFLFLFPLSLYFRKRIPLQGVAHQVGTCRFGEDPKTSVLDLNCRTHDVDNLYVVDGRFFPSSGAVNPSLTIMANAMRVGEHILERMG